MTNGAIEIRGTRRRGSVDVYDVVIRENIDGRVHKTIIRGVRGEDHKAEVARHLEDNQQRRDERNGGG